MIQHQRDEVCYSFFFFFFMCLSTHFYYCLLLLLLIIIIIVFYFIFFFVKNNDDADHTFNNYYFLCVCTMRLLRAGVLQVTDQRDALSTISSAATLIFRRCSNQKMILLIAGTRRQGFYSSYLLWEKELVGGRNAGSC